MLNIITLVFLNNNFANVMTSANSHYTNIVTFFLTSVSKSWL